VSELREKLEDVLKGEWTKISTTVNIVDVVLPPEPKTREQFLQYSCQLTLDPNTAGKRLSLSEGNRKVTCTGQDQLYPDHPERFTTGVRFCVERVCLDAVTGRWSGVGRMFIQQSHIKTSAEQGQMVDLDTITSPGVYSTIVVVIGSYTIMLGLKYQALSPPE
ncbi:hypothetical protein J4Q44_G00207520, partial [Coregonus suidteri]